jgi:hypothetical protein
MRRKRRNLQCPAGHALIESTPVLFTEEEDGTVTELVDVAFDDGVYTANVQFEADPPPMRSLRVAVPRFPATFCVHPKLMLLKFKNYLRIVISSFNLSEEQCAQASDVFWWVDLPLLPKKQQPPAAPPSVGGRYVPPGRRAAAAPSAPRPLSALQVPQRNYYLYEQ